MTGPDVLDGPDCRARRALLFFVVFSMWRRDADRVLSLSGAAQGGANNLERECIMNITHEEGVANICAILDAATAAEWAEGVAWYRKARTVAGIVGRAAGYKGKRAYTVGAGVVAALSPSCAWDTNMAAALAVADNGGQRLGTDASRFQNAANVAKAARIMGGAPVLDVLGGDKVRAFFACIADPSDSHAVCVDRHAAAVAFGRSLSEKEMREAVKVTKKGGSNYERIADMYRAAAAARGLSPMDVQAITWVAWRRLKGEGAVA